MTSAQPNMIQPARRMNRLTGFVGGVTVVAIVLVCVTWFVDRSLWNGRVDWLAVGLFAGCLLVGEMHSNIVGVGHAGRLGDHDVNGQRVSHSLGRHPNHLGRPTGIISVGGP